jgi:ribonuclease HI
MSDSFSCIKALENRKLSNPQILEILELVHKLVTFGYSIHFIWVPSHIGIAGNAAADAAAKAALNLQSSMLTVPYSDFKSLINTYIKKRW